MAESTWDKLTDGMRDDDLAMLERFRDLALAFPEAELDVKSTEIHIRRKRIFASAYIKSHYLEAAIDLLREAEHPTLRTAFHTTKKVITHRLTISKIEQLDDAVSDLLAEAYETVGPGTR